MSKTIIGILAISTALCVRPSVAHADVGTNQQSTVLLQEERSFADICFGIASNLFAAIAAANAAALKNIKG